MIELELVKEAKVADLLDVSDRTRLEASGVLARDGFFYVVFDNAPQIGRFSSDLFRGIRQNSLIPVVGGLGRQYEDIAFDHTTSRFYLLIEALPHGHGYLAAVEEYDENFRCLERRCLDFPLDRPNKGLEGLTCRHRQGEIYLLGLCEGNRCKAGSAGREPGGGRIQVFRAGRRRWDHVGTIRLPETLEFADYSSLSVAADRIAVVSQESSALWVGQLEPSTWELTGDGTAYAFPRDSKGRIVYGNVEGVSWVAADQVVVVSDRAKAQQHRFRAKEQSIHVFALPTGARRTIA